MSDRDDRVRELFRAARQLGSDQRDRLFDEACHDDTTGIREEVEALLASDRQPDGLLGAAWTDNPDATLSLAAGATWGHLRVFERIGQGGFGEVYRALDTRLDREVALKLLRPTSDDVAISVIEEGRLMARVRHPNVVSVFGAERRDDHVGLWMELVRGRTLSALVKERGPYGSHEAVAIGTELCGALAAVHGAGLLHRDVKAGNVMREEGGRIVLMDFGAGGELNQASQERRLRSGTPLYMAPELFERGPASVRSDIYGLGVSLYYLVTGSFPVEADSLEELASKHRERKRNWLRDRRPDLPPRFVQAVERAIAPQPEERFSSAGELEAALRDVTPQGRDARRARPWVIAITASLLLVAALVVGVRWLRDPLSTATAPAGEPPTSIPQPVREHESAEHIEDPPLPAADHEEPALAAADTETRLGQIDDLRKLATVHMAQGGFETAAGLYRQLLQLQTSGDVASTEAQVARTRVELGWALQRQREWPEARAQYEAALAAQTALWGEEHAEVAATLEKLALLLCESGDCPSAEQPMLRAAEIRRRVHGESHALVASSLSRLADLYQKLDRVDEAKRHLEQATAIRARLLGIQPPSITLLSPGTASSEAPYTLRTELFVEREGEVGRLRAGDRVAIGDAVFLTLQSSDPVHVYILTEDATGLACLGFPIPGYSPGNPLAPRDVHRLPPTKQVGNDLIGGSWAVTTVGLHEYVSVFASPAPIEEFETVLAGIVRDERSADVPCFREEEGPLEPLRGMSRFAVSPAPSAAAPQRLFEHARHLVDGTETVEGLVIRRFELENPAEEL